MTELSIVKNDNDSNTSNILNFPTTRIYREVPPNIDEIESHKQKAMVKLADNIAENLIDNIYETLDQSALDVDVQSFKEDFTVLSEFAKSLVYRSLGIHHSLQYFIDTCVDVDVPNYSISIRIETEPTDVVQLDSEGDESNEDE